ncbi:mitochondrial carrier domain-containing protein [Melampsora americana]|nr:mitochondrial carrier domain-containing protein [Melampsora americana]
MDLNLTQPSTSSFEPFSQASTTLTIRFTNVSEKAIGKMKAKSSLPDTPEQQTGKDLNTLEQADPNELSSVPSNRKNTSPFEGAGKYLLSGGIAGMVSRTATAPFDRVKIYLITAEKPLSIQTHPSPSFATLSGSRATIVLPPQQPIYRLIPKSSKLLIAVKLIYEEPAGARPGPGGLRNFFVGNGLNVLKIFPESAIKFLTYEYIKMALGQGCLGMSPATDANGNLTNIARFFAGGLGGVVSQFAIYPIETLKTQIMSSTLNHNVKRSALLFQTIRRLNASGGIKPYYKGIAAATVGVFPYSEFLIVLTIEMILEQRLISLGESPGVLGTLACGALSGGIGASSVYPINLVRTRLQAQGTSGHPATYRGIGDCVERTWRKEGLRGFYKGLAPSLFKVMPAVSISWLVYERTILMLDRLS